jgi:hypothetical protein
VLKAKEVSTMVLSGSAVGSRHGEEFRRDSPSSKSGKATSMFCTPLRTSKSIYRGQSTTLVIGQRRWSSTPSFTPPSLLGALWSHLHLWPEVPRRSRIYAQEQDGPSASLDYGEEIRQRIA